MELTLLVDDLFSAPDPVLELPDRVLNLPFRED